MYFAMAAADQYLGVFEAFVQAGWKPLKLFAAPYTHDAVVAYARQQQATIQLSRLTQRDLLDLQQQGCDALIVACYDWRIPEWRQHLQYAFNFHCSPLPEGRGPCPLHRAILENRSSWAVTCHCLTAEIDAGDILAAEYFPLQSDECHQRLDLKVQMAAKRLAATVATHLSSLWMRATPQEAGSYWPKHTLDERIIDFHQPVETILRHIRAFGATESLANINDVWLTITRGTGWLETHALPSGTVAHTYKRTVVVAAADGYVALLDWGAARQETVEVLHSIDAIIASHLPDASDAV